MFVLFLTVLIDLIGFGMIIPILPFAAPRFGATELDIAMILVTYSVCGALASPLWGRLSDRWGRKKTLLACLAGTAACYGLLAMVTTLWALYAVRILAGCFTGNFSDNNCCYCCCNKQQPSNNHRCCRCGWYFSNYSC